MSRRLDISALLCDDDEPIDHVAHNPRPSSSHTRQPAPPISAPSPPASNLHPLHRPRANTFAYPPEPSSSKAGAFVGFDALVHAATVERRRLSSGELTHPQPHLQQPPQHHHVQHQQPVQHQHNHTHNQLQQQPQQPPPPHHLNQQQPRLSPQFRRSPWQEEQQEYAHPPPRQLQSPLESPRDVYKTPSSPFAPRHPMDDRVQQMRHLQLIDPRSRPPHTQQHDLDRLHRAQEFHHHQQQQQQRERRAEEERLAELERQNMLERQKMEEERRKLEEERMRLAELERQLREKDAARQREDEKREELRRLEEERRREREIAAIREAERREHHRRESELLHKMELQRQEEQQRIYDMQRAELERHRRQQLQLQQQQQAQLAHEQQQAQQQQQQQYAFHHQQQLRSPQQRHYEPPPRIEIPPGPQHPVRKVDQSPPTKLQSQSPNLAHAHPDQRPAKKARYSDSPSLPPILIDDKDRIARERERMSVGEIGYGRIESPVAGPPSSSSSSAVPRRPVSGTGVRRPVSVSDLLSPEPQPPLLPTPIEPHHPPLRIISREKDPGPPPNHHHRILSPLGRRSPPGSQAGRAKAARKSDEHVASLNALTPSVSASSTSSISAPAGAPSSQPPPPPLVPSVKKSIVREEQVVKRQKVEEVPSPMPLEVLQRTPVSVISTKEIGEQVTHSHQHRHFNQPTAPPPASAPRQVKDKSQPPSSQPQQQQGDAHDWLLEHFAQPSPPSKKDHHRHAAPRHTRSPSVPSQRRTLSPVVQVKKQSPSPVVQDEGDNALEQELEELLAEVDVPLKEESMDVDSVVAELVAETLEGDDEEVEDSNSRAPYQPADGGEEEPMPLDDELLSLIDDTLPSSTSMGKRVPAPPTSASSPLIPSTGRHSKQVPPPLRTSESGSGLPSHTSPTGGPSSASASLSTSAKLERESMPPPSIAGKKDKEQEDASTKDSEGVASAVAASAASKKKKEGTSTSKKSKGKATGADSMKIELSTPTEDSQATVAAKSRPKAAKGKKAAAAAIASAKLEASANAVPALASNGTAASSSKAVPSTTKAGHAPSATSRKHTSVSVASRSRSTSVMPGITSEHAAPTPSSSVAEDKAEKGDKQEEEEEEAAGNDDDNRLYCVCKTKYDQERFMIACDRCDEWYHMQCVDMSELVADLVDQFFCPPCIEKNPGVDLHTTYKLRCLWGLKHPDPDSPRACHKPARGAFSKYCSEDCGVKYMQSRIDTWAKKGGKKDKLWESVKNVEKREGVVVRLEDDDNTSSLSSCHGKSDLDCQQAKESTGTLKNGALKASKPKKAKGEREKERLTKMLDQVMRTSNDLKKGMGVLAWREKLLELATERAETVTQCGWDQRLCYGDEEWVEHGQSVFESYEDRGDGDMDVDGQSDNGEGDWWCAEEAACSRHMGWQTTRYKDICKEKEKKEEALHKLSGRESDIRKRLEDIANPQLKRKGAASNANHQDRTTKAAPHQGPLTSANAKLSNGNTHRNKGPVSETIKKGKKRKAPAS
ncbi:hypothetical protein EST38_g5984 [Candolleomyces aberdarensis]|uniref:PHD-type domain-containing protein n=1 Tax=Candolleomyces aberdarensis TaxID=2316362 RepID=A0A4V1Q3V3_9AGAR|nr:hypothetical protein EST38_g5984 [Candolleomyces aberdarensis]